MYLFGFGVWMWFSLVFNFVYIYSSMVFGDIFVFFKNREKILSAFQNISFVGLSVFDSSITLCTYIYHIYVCDCTIVLHTIVILKFEIIPSKTTWQNHITILQFSRFFPFLGCDYMWFKTKQTKNVWRKKKWKNIETVEMLLKSLLLVQNHFSKFND